MLEKNDCSLPLKKLTWLSQKGITLNKEKCELNKPILNFYGHVFGEHGLSPSPAKVSDIKNCDPPSNVSELRSLLGMATYCSRFIRGYSTIVHPLRELTKQGVKWTWGTSQQNALDKLKEALASDTCLSYFSPTRSTELYVDASPTGLSGILVQRDRDDSTYVIGYGSRSLTDPETRYSQTEREALAVLWAAEHFHLYVYGSFFTVITDHKPLVSVFNKPNSRPPIRIERWCLKLQQFNFQVRYEPGSSNPANYMSRHPAQKNKEIKSEAEDYVCYIAENTVPKSMTLEQIQGETETDPILQKVADLVQKGNWYTVNELEDSESFDKVKHELTVTNNSRLVLRGQRIVIPKKLQQQAVDIAHEGHFGTSRTKALLREKVWFPGVDQLVERTIKGCIACQATTPVSKSREPLIMSQMPDQPWTELAADFYGPLEYLLLVFDEHSRYPIVEIVSSTSAVKVIPVLDKIFSMFGIPKILKTDNGPPWNGTQITQFAQHLGFKHRKITPLWPEANAEAERFMRVIGKTLKTAKIQNKPWRQSLNEMLRNYRTTPHCTTNTSPAILLFGRDIQTKLPQTQFQEESKLPVAKKAKLADQSNKGKMKAYADKRRCSNKSNFDIGTYVLVKQPQHNKMTPLYNPHPYQIVSVKGSMITAQRGTHKVTRNSSHYKAIPEPMDANYPVEKENKIYDSLDDIPLRAGNRPPPILPAEENVNIPVRRNPMRNRRLPLRYQEDEG